MTTCPTCYQVVNTARSGQDHKRFFAVIAAYYDHWPEDYIASNGNLFQPKSAEHLRAFLLCEAGFKTATTITVPDFGPGVVALCEEMLEVKKGFFFREWRGLTLTVTMPESIQYTNASKNPMARTKWNKFREAAEEILYGVHNMPVIEFMKEHERAA